MLDDRKIGIFLVGMALVLYVPSLVVIIYSLLTLLGIL